VISHVAGDGQVSRGPSLATLLVGPTSDRVLFKRAPPRFVCRGTTRRWHAGLRRKSVVFGGPQPNSLYSGDGSIALAQVHGRLGSGDVVRSHRGVTAHQAQRIVRMTDRFVSFSFPRPIRYVRTDLTVGEDPPHRRCCWSSTWIQSRTFAPVAVELGAAARVSTLVICRGMNFLHVLIRPVVVGAVRDRRGHTVGPHPTHATNKSAAAFVDEYGLDGFVRRGLGETVAQSPVRGRRTPRRWTRDCNRTLCRRTASSTVNVPTTLARRKRLGIGGWLGVVDVSFRGEVHDGVGLGDEAWTPTRRR